ncbi:MAG: hypothetical protein P9M14_16710 [Candidatus Alcyoniella australis]|nr:hypothetical protein [Candidatus Alcyoniella australis]
MRTKSAPPIACLAILALLLVAPFSSHAVEPGRYVAYVMPDEQAVELILELEVDGTFSYVERNAGKQVLSYQGSYVSNGSWLAMTHAQNDEQQPGPQGLTRTFIVTQNAGSIILAPFDSDNIYSFAILPVSPERAVRYLQIVEGHSISPIGRYNGSYKLPNDQTRNIELVIRPDRSFVYREKKPGRSRRMMGIMGDWDARENRLTLRNQGSSRISVFQYAIVQDMLQLKRLDSARPPLAVQPKTEDQGLTYQRSLGRETQFTELYEPHGLHGRWRLDFQNQQLSTTRCELKLLEPHRFEYSEQVLGEPAARLELSGTFRLDGDALILVLPKNGTERSFNFRLSADGKVLELSTTTTNGRFAFPVSPVLVQFSAPYERIVETDGPKTDGQLGQTIQ